MLNSENSFLPEPKKEVDFWFENEPKYKSNFSKKRKTSRIEPGYEIPVQELAIQYYF